MIICHSEEQARLQAIRILADMNLCSKVVGIRYNEESNIWIVEWKEFSPEEIEEMFDVEKEE